MNSNAQLRKTVHPPDAHPLAVFLLREGSPFQAFLADLGDHDWRIAEAAYRRGDVGVMVERLAKMAKRKRIVYLKKDDAEKVESKKGE